MREKIEDSSLGLLAPKLLGEGGPDLHYFFQDNNAFGLMPHLVKPYSRRKICQL